MYVKRSDLTPLGYRQLSVDSVATVVPPVGATRVLIQPDGDIRLRDDGISPTVTSGLLVANGSIFELTTTGDLRVIGTVPGILVSLNYYGA
jgi:hypothetical protein